MTEGKVCHGACKEWRPLDRFSKRKGTPDGLRYICKECENDYRRQSYRADPEKSKKASARWVAENPDRARENARVRAKRYRERHPEKVRESSRKYYERTKKGKQN